MYKGTAIAQVLAVLATVTLLICPTLTVAQSNGNIITAENVWIPKAAMPTARSRLQTNLAHGKIYVMGGDPNQSLNYAYDPVTDRWAVKAPIPNVVTEGFNRAAIYASSAVLDDKIYWIGVTSFTNSMNLANQLYDPETDTWSQRSIPPWHLLPSAGAAITGEFAAKKIHVIGQNSQEHYAYDPVGDNWTKSTPLTDPRFEVGITVLNDTIYVIGGRYFYSTSTSVHQYIPSEYKGVIYDVPTPEPTQTCEPTPTATPAPTEAPTPQEPQPTATAEPTTAPESSAADAATQTILIAALIVGITIIGLAFVIWKRHQQTVEQRSHL